MLKIQWWTLPVFDLISKILYYWNCIENLGQRNKFQNLLPIGDKGSLYTQLLDRGVYLQNKISPPIPWYLPSEKKSPPLYDVGDSFRLTRIIHPQIKYKDGDARLILNPQISTVLKNGLKPRISLFYQEGKPLEKIQASKLFVGPGKRTTSVKLSRKHQFLWTLWTQNLRSLITRNYQVPTSDETPLQAPMLVTEI